MGWAFDPTRGPKHKRVTDLPLGEGNRHVRQNLQCCPLLGTQVLTPEEGPVHSWSFAVGGNNWVMMGVALKDVDTATTVFSLGDAGQAWMLFGGYSGVGMLVGPEGAKDKSAVAEANNWPALAPGDTVRCVLDLSGEGTLAFQVSPRMATPMVVFRGLKGKALCPVVSTNNKNATLELLGGACSAGGAQVVPQTTAAGTQSSSAIATRYLPREDDEPLEEVVKRIEVGARCKMIRGDHRGEVKVVGLVPELDGSVGLLWVGVELDEPFGDCDGTPFNSSKSYFQCLKNQGIFLRPFELETGDFPEDDPFASSDED